MNNNGVKCVLQGYASRPRLEPQVPDVGDKIYMHEVGIRSTNNNSFIIIAVVVYIAFVLLIGISAQLMFPVDKHPFTRLPGITKFLVMNI